MTNFAQLRQQYAEQVARTVKRFNRLASAINGSLTLEKGLEEEKAKLRPLRKLMLNFTCPDRAVMNDQCNRFAVLIKETVDGIEAPLSDDFDTIEEMLEDWALLLQTETLARAQKATN